MQTLTSAAVRFFSMLTAASRCPRSTRRLTGTSKPCIQSTQYARTQCATPLLVLFCRRGGRAGMVISTDVRCSFKQHNGDGKRPHNV